MAQTILLIGVRQRGCSSLLDYRLRSEFGRLGLDFQLVMDTAVSMAEIDVVIIHHEGHFTERDGTGLKCVQSVRDLRTGGYTGPIIAMADTQFRPLLLEAGVTVWLSSCSCRAATALCELLPQVLEKTL